MPAPFGKLLVRETDPPEIKLKPGDPGYCEMSEETRQAIEEFEKNMQQAMANARLIWVD